MSEFGSGPSLDSDWDLYVDGASGDIATSSGVTELGKDLSFNITRAITGEISGPVDDGELRDIEIYIRKIVLADDRVDSVSQLDASFNPRTGEVTVDIGAVGVDGTVVDVAVTV